MSRAARLLALVAAAGCAGPPLYMGQPLNGRVSIPPHSARLTVAEQRSAARAARASGRTVLELVALLGLEEAERADAEERLRLAELLELRGRELAHLGQAIAAARDLDGAARLDPRRGAALRAARADTLRDAGDTWLAIGDGAAARAAYEQAAALGAREVAFRLRAVAGQPPPPGAPLAALEAEIAALPLRALPLLARAYVTRGGGDRATLERCLAGARQAHDATLAERVSDALALASEPETISAASPPPPAPPPLTSAPTSTWAAVPQAIAMDIDGYLLGGPSLSARLLPLAARAPGILDDRERTLRWADLLLAEDPWSPDVLELVALVFGRAGRFGGTERMLIDLAYFTPDRAAGLARAATLWERVGRPREACAQWIRAARWRDDPEDPTWRRAVACTRRDPGAGDWRAIRQYVLDRAPPDRRDAIAAALDAP
jgi:tetratricopeptide (TPR) repeat protein